MAGVFRHRSRPDDGGRRNGQPAGWRKAATTASLPSAAAARSIRQRECPCLPPMAGRCGTTRFPAEIPNVGLPVCGDSDNRRHRLGGNALYGHHGYRNRRENVDCGPCLLPGRYDRRLRAHPDDAVAADRRYRARQPDARDRGLCQPPRQSLHRRPCKERDGADRAAISVRPAPSPTTGWRARR